MKVREFLVFVLRLRFIRLASVSGVLVFTSDGERLVSSAPFRRLLIPCRAFLVLTVALLRIISVFLTDVSFLSLRNRLFSLGLDVCCLRDD